MTNTTQRNPTDKWRDFEPEHALLGGILHQACRDALQTANPTLSQEAWQFLEMCAPDVAARLRKRRGRDDQLQSA